MTDINLVAVQVELKLEPYLSADAFKRWIFELCEEALAALPDAPTLLAFPEAVGMPLLLLLDVGQQVREAERLGQALTAHLRQGGLELLLSGLRRPRLGLAGVLLPRALPAYRAYRGAFAAAAKTFGVTVVAGSSFLPMFDEEGLRGTHLGDPRVYNLAMTFAPTGTLLGVSKKTKLTPGLESRLGLSRGRLEDARPLHTPAGRVGVAICLDAFFESVVSHFDGLGTQILVQPSANFAPWNGRWSGGRGLSEGEAWLRYGLRSQLQDRLNLVYGVNPMLVGELWDLCAEGRTSLVANHRFHEGGLEHQPGLLAIAGTFDQGEVVRATVKIG